MDLILPVRIRQNFQRPFQTRRRQSVGSTTLASIESAHRECGRVCAKSLISAKSCKRNSAKENGSGACLTGETSWLGDFGTVLLLVRRRQALRMIMNKSRWRPVAS